MNEAVPAATFLTSEGCVDAFGVVAVVIARTEVWSNDLYVAPVHRVKAQRSLERYSAPFFYNPSYETNYAPVSGTVSDEVPAKYRPINWGEFRLGRFRGDYADSGAPDVQISDYLL